VSRIAPKKLLQPLIIDHVAGRENWCIILHVFSKISIPKTQKKKIRKNGKNYGKRVFDKIVFVERS